MQSQQRKNTIRMASISLTLCLLCFACLWQPHGVECGRLQDFIQSIVGGSNSNANSNSNSNSNANSNSNSNTNNDSNDSDAAATGDTNEQQMTPMMSAINPFMRYPSFYGGAFGPGSFGGYPSMSFPSPMTAMSPLSTMSTNSLGSFSPASFGASPSAYGSGFGSTYGQSSSSPMFGAGSGMSASSLSNVFASSPSLMSGYTPYYGKR